MDYPPEFEELWNLYPKRPGNPKFPAYKEWMKVTKTCPPQMILEGAKKYAEFCKSKKPEFICHTRTWLHQRRWESDYTESTEISTEAILRSQSFTINLGHNNLPHFEDAIVCLKRGLITEAIFIDRYGRQAENWLRKRAKPSGEKTTILSAG